jgi:hypothetical protein
MNFKSCQKHRRKANIKRCWSLNLLGIKLKEKRKPVDIEEVAFRCRSYKKNKK